MLIAFAGDRSQSMIENPQLRRTTPNPRPAPTKTDAELQEQKRLEKMQTVCSSHHVAGTLELREDDRQLTDSKPR